MLKNIAPLFWLYIAVYAVVFFVNRHNDQARANSEFSKKIGTDFLDPEGQPPTPVYVKTTRRLLKESLLPSFCVWIVCILLYLYV